MSVAHIIHAVADWWVFVRIGQSGLLQAALTALAGWLAVGAVSLYLTRKRVAWRAYMDAEFRLHPELARHIEQARKAEPAGPRVKFRVFLEKPHPDPVQAALGMTQETEVQDPSLVLLRIRNSGFVPISGTEFDPLLKFRFPGREVRGAQPIDTAGNARESLLLLPEDEIPPTAPARPSGLVATARAVIRAMFGTTPAGTATLVDGSATAGPAVLTKTHASGDHDSIRLSPTVRLNAKERISALLVLSGKPAGERERIEQPEGKILRGKINKERPRTGPIPISPRALVALLVPVALIGVIVGQLATQPTATVPVAESCTGGSLTLIGSTAFAPVATTIAGAYAKACPAARISVAPDSNGSVFGLTTLVADGQAKHAAGVIAMSDGPAPAESTYRPLRGKPIAIIIFTVAVNKGVGLRDLTATDIRKMYNGTYTNWSQLKGPDIPIRLISREFGSGTRRAFDADVLGTSEPSPTSFDCKSKPASAQITLCTVEQTGDMLADIGTIPGALGFAQTGDVANTGGGVQPVALNGLSPDFGDIGRSGNAYSFWTVEYLYTYGPATGIADAFLKYLGTPTALSDLQAAEYTPCPADGRGRAGALCTQAGS